MAIRLFQSAVEWNTEISRRFCQWAEIHPSRDSKSTCMNEFFWSEVGLVIFVGITAIRSAYTCLKSRKISLLKSHTEALIKAATLGDTKEVKRMILLGANVNAHDSDGYTPLMLASRKGFLEVMLALLRAGANIEAGNLKTPALIEAAQFGHVEAVRLLLAAGANVNDRIPLTGDTALNYAVMHRKIELVRVLLQAGADVDLEGTLGSPLSYACKMSPNVEMVETLLNEAKVINTSKIIDILSQGVFNNATEGVLEDYLSKKGLPVESLRAYLSKRKGDPKPDLDRNIRETVRNTMGHIYGLSTVTANPKRSTSIPYTLEKFDENTEKFFTAAYSGDVNELRDLIKAGLVAVNTYNHNHFTALMEASCHGHLAAVILLLGKGADINACNRFGETALSLAVLMGHETIVRILMIYRADLEKEDLDHKTPLLLAMVNDRTKVMRILLEGGASFTPDTLAKISKLGRMNAVRDLLSTQDPKAKEPEVLNKAFLSASENGQVETMGLLLDKGADINARDILDNTSIMCCANRGHFEAVQELVRRGADHRRKNKHGETAYEIAKQSGYSGIWMLLRALREADQDALMQAADEGDTNKLHELVEKGIDIKCELYPPGPLQWACKKGHLEFVRALFSLGVVVSPVEPHSPERRCEDREIHAASKNGHTDIVRLLVSKGADVNAKGEWGRTPVMLASESGHLTTVELLLQMGAHVNDLKSNEQKNGLMLRACERGDTELVRVLLEAGADENARGEWAQTLLILASKNGHLTTVELLLKSGARINDLDYWEQNSLMHASKGGHLSVTKVLLEKGADVNAKGSRSTPLIYASQNGHLTTVEHLLNSGASVNTFDLGGQNALMHASENGHLNVAKVLLEAGAIVNAGRSTAIHIASEKGYRDIVELLVSKRADVHAKNGRNCTPLMCASENGHLTTVQFLLKSGARVDELNTTEEWNALMYASIGGHQEVVKALLEAGADVNAKGRWKKTSLMCASENSRLTTVNFLLKSGARINDFDCHGQNALMHASIGGHLDVAKVLQEAGAGVNDKVEYGHTALMCASGNGHLTTVEFLLKSGASVNDLDRGGWNALKCAVKGRHRSVAKTLLDAGAEISNEAKAILF